MKVYLYFYMHKIAPQIIISPLSGKQMQKIPHNYGDRSDDFYCRVIIIRFERFVPENNRDPNLREKLAVECDGIFMWASAGLKQLIANSYIFTETELKATVHSPFVEECCVLDKKAECSREEMFQAVPKMA